jgi:kumamolisin
MFMITRFLGAIALGSLLATGVLFDQAEATPGFLEMPQAARARALVPAHADLAPSDRGVASDVARARGLRDFGELRSSSPVEIGLLMRARNEAQLRALTLAQGNSHSRYYHHYLTTEQFKSYFSPDAGTYRRTLATLQRRGFRITATYPNRTFIRAVANAGIVERYFSTRIHAYFQQGQKGLRYGNITPAVMPEELKRDVVDVSGLHTIVTMHYPIRFADKNIVTHSAQYRRALAQVLAQRKASATRPVAVRPARHPFNVPTPLSTATPQANPSPDATESPGTPATDYVNSIGGYDPTIYADAYDYPVQHGYGGRNHATASVISSDYADTDAMKEFSTFNIPRTGKAYRECGDPNGGPTCGGLIGAGDADGESTLDAETIMSLAPAADFYEYLTDNGLSDIGIESDYILANNQNVAEVVNSSFGGCETDDPAFGYATNYIAMEGAALGITYSASTGDTGSTECGTEVMNGAPAEYINISDPSSGTYFTADGGTDFYQLLTCTGVQSACYTLETGWTFGGGGTSVILPLPAWQEPAVAAQTVVAEVGTTGRNTPDVVFTADELPPGVGMDIFLNGSQAAVGGTSVASPMFVAMQSEINQVQNSRNGWVNPGLYVAFMDFNTTTTNFAFRDITGGTNVRYQAVPGYDDATGLGSPIGWNLAAVENGYPGATPRPGPVTPPPTAAPTVGPSASPTPVPTAPPTPHASGTTNVVTTIAGKMCASAGTSTDATNPELACFANPTAILYVAGGAVDAQTDDTLFLTDYSTGFLRSLDLGSAGTTPGAVVTENNSTWNNATRATTAGGVPSQLYGLMYATEASASFAGLYVISGGDNSAVQVTLPTTPTADTPGTSSLKALAGTPAAGAFSIDGAEAGISTAKSGTFFAPVFAAAINDDASASILPNGGNFGMAFDTANLEFYVTDSMGNSITSVVPAALESMATLFVTGAPLNEPKGITYLNSSFYVANCGGNNIIKVTSAGVMSVTAGDGAAKETDGDNTGAEFNCPFGITNDGTNLYVTDLSGNTVREITNVQ